MIYHCRDADLHRYVEAVDLQVLKTCWWDRSSPQSACHSRKVSRHSNILDGLVVLVERPEEGLVLPGAISHVVIDPRGEKKLVVLQDSPQDVGSVEFIELNTHQSAMTPYIAVAPDIWRWYALSTPQRISKCHN